MRITSASFEELDLRTAYAVWRLRQQVFVVEQDCPYLDLDDRDQEPGTRHLLLHDGDQLAGYVRVLAEPEAMRIGRVVLDPAFRGRGLADDLMRTAIEQTGERPVLLAAQAPLAGWYATFGFVVDGPGFLEDGIPHVPMRREPGP
ncbi:GNAT family N-acetyltransferase [Nocardioides mangrovicus]|uniref:GNAT family N-acetyltransferase n=1 Tax=Nocardioides mangrovicus TaxID=2478913 RepID=UPI001E3BAE83|nr:GNAT family N-acetyltransferase [Nocardioides mangrovicus]